MTPQEEFAAFNEKTRNYMDKGLVEPHEAFGDIRIKADELGLDHGLSEEDQALERLSMGRHDDMREARMETRKKFGESGGYFSLSKEAQDFLNRNYNDRRRKRGDTN